jgi:hypothetical protein
MGAVVPALPSVDLARLWQAIYMPLTDQPLSGSCTPNRKLYLPLAAAAGVVENIAPMRTVIRGDNKLPVYVNNKVKAACWCGTAWACSCCLDQAGDVVMAPWPDSAAFAAGGSPAGMLAHHLPPQLTCLLRTKALFSGSAHWHCTCSVNGHPLCVCPASLVCLMLNRHTCCSRRTSWACWS